MRREPPSARMVREIHGTGRGSLDSFLESISIQDMLDAYNGGEAPELLMAAALEKEAAKLRSKTK